MDSLYTRDEYSKADFWNQQFQKSEKQFDWYIGYKEFKVYLDKSIGIDKKSKILMVGVGNSKLTEQMHEYGYENTVNIDICDNVIEQMKNKTKNKNIIYLQMDATKMSFEGLFNSNIMNKKLNLYIKDDEFDYVIDKGTLDALMCGSKLGTVLIKEMLRVLKPKGRLIIISHGSPEMRNQVFQPIQQYKIKYCKQNLSDDSQMINSIRCQLKDKPLKSIFQDEIALKNMIQEIKKFNRVQLFRKLLTPKLIDFQFENIEEKTQSETVSYNVYQPKRQTYCYIYEITKN